MSDRWIYHYHGFCQEPDREIHIDGIATSDTPVLTMDDYRRIKKVIVGDTIPDPDKMTITSFTLLASPIQRAD